MTRIARLLRIVLFGFLIGQLSLVAMVFDNRYIPLLAKPLYRRPDDCSFFAIQPFFMVANRGWAPFGEHNILREEFGLYEWHGFYDELVLDKAIVNAGLSPTSLLRSDFQFRPSIPWAMEGELHTIGFALYWYRQLSHLFGVGGSWVFMHANGMMEHILDPSVVDRAQPGDERELLMSKAQMHHLLGLTPDLWSRTGSGDLDLYFRIGGMTEYRWKLRRLDAGVKLGIIIPIAAPIDPCSPSSITFGGNRHFGMYVSLEGEAELKEDLRAGLLIRFIQRFSKVEHVRVPVLTEPTIFGAAQSSVLVDPGFTFVLSPYVAFDEVRDGVGFFIQYTLLLHEKDEIFGLRKDMASIPVNLNALAERSSWVNEYVTLGIGYDPHSSRQEFSWLPKVSFYWDIPVNPTLSKRSNKTNGISLLLKFDF